MNAIESQREATESVRARAAAPRPWTMARWMLGAPLVVFVLCVIGIWQVGYKQEITGGMQHLGHADPCSYAVIARSLYEGRGFDVDYITFHFIAYPREVTHREDHWPVLMSILMAGMYCIFGEAAWVARLTSFAVASLLLPLATAWLGFVYARRAYVGLVAGALMLGSESFFNVSMETYSDILTAVCVISLCAAVIRTRERPWMHLAAGLMAAACFYAKGSLILMVGIYPAAALLACGWGTIRSRWMWAGLAVAIIGVTPWLISSWRLYGNPLHCTQNFVGGFYGIDNYEVNGRTPTWGKGSPRPPHVSDRWTKYADKYERRWRSSAQATLTWAALGFVGADAWLDLGPAGGWIYDRIAVDDTPRAPAEYRRVWGWQNPITMLCGIFAMALVVAVMLTGLFRMAVRWTRRIRTKSDIDEGSPEPVLYPTVGATLAILLIVGIQGVFVTFIWQAEPRFLLMFIPAAAVLGVTALSRLVELPAALFAPRLVPSVDRLLAPAGAVVVLGAVAIFGSTMRGVHQLQARLDKYPYEDHYVWQLAVGAQLRAALPRDAVLMTRHPWELNYFTRLKTVVTPYASPADIFSICRYYKVTHFFNDAGRPGMQEFTTGKHPGLVPVPGSLGNLFEVRYEYLPDSGLAGED